METRRPDAVFRDPYAARLAGEKGQAITDSMTRGRQMAWAMIVRTYAIDELVMQAVKRDGVDLIVNLAAGLDARPWRMNLPASLRWVDVDLPGILDYKLGVIGNEPTKCRYEAIRVDLRDAAKRQALFQQLGRSSSRALVIAEGLLIYLTPDDVRGLASDLSAAGFKWWIIDIAHPRLLKMMSKMWAKRGEMANAPFLFAPEENTRFFEPSGWREKEFRSSMAEAKRIDRQMPGMWFWGFIGRFYPKKTKEMFKRFSGIALLERA
jgi:methyltransferase (TIGR00027 family)